MYNKCINNKVTYGNIERNADISITFNENITYQLLSQGGHGLRRNAVLEEGPKYSSPAYFQFLYNVQPSSEGLQTVRKIYRPTLESAKPLKIVRNLRTAGSSNLFRTLSTSFHSGYLTVYYKSSKIF
jgi:hypothetical protein